MEALLLQLGTRIRAARKRARMTQQNVAAKLGVTQTAVSYWEAGKRDPRLPVLLRLAEVLGTTLSALIPDEITWLYEPTGCSIHTTERSPFCPACRGRIMEDGGP